MSDQSPDLDDPGETAASPGVDPLFAVDEESQRPAIFNRRELLRVGHVPNHDRIVGRDDRIEEVATELRPAVRGEQPKNVVIYGKTGTGKSLVARHVTERAQRAAESNGVTLGRAYIDCAQRNTETRAARALAQALNDAADAPIDVPASGIGSTEYYDYLWQILDEGYDSAIVILDEVDRLQNDDILMQLSRARESGKTECPIGIVAVSNKIEYRDRLGERVKSSLQERDFVFDPYDATQLKEILSHRRDAFVDGVLDDGVIELTAALAANEHGDARKAVEILHQAGDLAQRDRSERVTEDHVREAQKWAEVNRLERLLEGSTTQVKYVLYSLALLTMENPDEEAFSTSRIYERYQETVDTVDVSSITENRVYQLLKEQAFLGVLESTRTGGGRGQGMYLEHRLIQDPEVVLKSVVRDTQLEAME
jgi:cell division control protein 6